MTESIYIVAILAGLLLLLKTARADKKAAIVLALLTGLTLGFAVLLRQLFLLIVPLLLIWLWWARHKIGGQRPLIPSIVILAIIILMILPFTIFNASQFDRFVLLNTNAGYAFYWANHPVYGTRFQPILERESGNYRDLIPQEYRHGELDEAALDQKLLGLGIQFVVDDPGRYVLLSLSRIPVYFMFWPSIDSGLLSNISRVGGFGLLLPFMIYGTILPFWDRERYGKSLIPVALFLIFIVAYTLIHILSWSLIRYRLPVDAVWILFGALGMNRIAEKIGIPVAPLPESFAS